MLDSSLHLSSINIYDNKGRLIQTQSENITGGLDVTTTQYSWAGWPLVTVQKQQFKKGTTSETTVVVTKMTYDDLGRLVKTEMKESCSLLNNGAMSAFTTTSELAYDALGQVTEKKLGKRRNSATAYTTTPLETQKYDYNIRGWLLGVNRDYVNDASSTNTTATVGVEGVISGEMFTESSMDIQSVVFPSSNFFGFDLAYDKKTDANRIYNIPYDSARYDGNITGMTWKGANDMKVRKYDFGYDPVSRLTKANFGQLTGTAFSKATVNYDVTNLNYDGNGNILRMNQYGLKPSGSSAIIDQLSYTYKTNSNKLTKVTDLAPSTATDELGDFQDGVNSGDDYAYDGNGNLISDQTGKISSISYNILNLPSETQVAGKGSIKYYYDATGNKLQKRTIDNTLSTTSPTVTNYIGGAVYLNDTLQFFGTPEGRVRIDTVIKGWVYDYYLSDHLGNTRMMLTDDYNVASSILEAYSYYPFGLQQKGIGITASGGLHNYKNTFQKQEVNEDLGLGLYEFKYRIDDPQLGRFWQVDPKADSFRYNSVYAFSENHLTTHVELEGLEKISIKDLWDKPEMSIEFLLDIETYYSLAKNINDLLGINSGLEVLSGKSAESNFTEDKPRINSMIELSMSILPPLRLEGSAYKLLTKEAASAAKTSTTALRKVGSVLESVDDVMANPNLLKGKSPLQVEGILGKTPGWKVETLGQGSQKGNGWVLRQYNAKGNPTGPQLRWHPGGGHHGPTPYWRVVGPNGDLGGIIR